MTRKPIALCLLTGVLTLGGAGVAAASPPAAGSPAPSGTNAQFNCTNAPKALARIAKLETRAQDWLPKAQARETKAQQAGKTDLAARIARRIGRVQRLESKGNALTQKIETLCPGSAPATGGTQS